jgi:quercetin dioxygenase-like cupin family protein
MSRLVDLDAIPPIEIWGDLVRARRVEGERLTLVVVELGPGAVVPLHNHPAEQIGVCARGTMTFTVGDETRSFGPGGTWRIPSGVQHEVLVGPDGAVVVEAFSPIRDDWDFPTLAPQPRPGRTGAERMPGTSGLAGTGRSALHRAGGRDDPCLVAVGPRGGRAEGGVRWALRTCRRRRSPVRNAGDPSASSPPRSPA